jgi:PhnB protein
MSIKGGRPVDRQISVKLFVRHGDEASAIAFYQEAMAAELLLKHTLPDGTLIGGDLRIGDSIITVAGANPRRDAESRLGGPRSPHALGTTATILDLYVADVDTTMKRALDVGAALRNPIENTPTGDRVGAFIDPFGHIWSLATAIEEVAASDVPARQRESADRSRKERRVG